MSNRLRLIVSLWGLASLSGLAACDRGGIVMPGVADAAADGDANGVIDGRTEGPPNMRPDSGTAEADPRCGSPTGNPVRFRTETEIASHLAGRWALCQGPGLDFLRQQNNQAGIELGIQKDWYILKREGAQLVRASGFRSSGTYSVPVPQDFMYNPSGNTKAILNFQGEGNATVTMLESPARVWLELNSSLYVLDGKP